jgi:hypothetical protein
LITGNVWQDYNASGTHNVGETNFAGVTVRLCTTPACTTVVATTTTDANGNYFFQVTAAGSYTIDVQTGTLPGGAAGWTQTGDRSPACAAACATTSTLGHRSATTTRITTGYQALARSRSATVGDWDGDGFRIPAKKASPAQPSLYADLDNDGAFDLTDRSSTRSRPAPTASTFIISPRATIWSRLTRSRPIYLPPDRRSRPAGRRHALRQPGQVNRPQHHGDRLRL